MRQSNEMATPSTDDDSEGSKKLLRDADDEKDLDRIGSSVRASASPRCETYTVEEFTLGSYNGENSDIVGSINGVERMHSRENQCEGLYQLADGSRLSHFHGQTGYQGQGKATSVSGGDDLYAELVGNVHAQQTDFSNNNAGNVQRSDSKVSSSDICGGSRTKKSSKAELPEHFIRSTLRGQGVIRRTQSGRGSLAETGDHDHGTKPGILDSTMGSASLTARSVASLPEHVTHPARIHRSRSAGDGFSLREWLEAGGQKAKKALKMHIFKQTLDLVHAFHSRGVPLQNLRPSCLVLYGSYQIQLVGSSWRLGAIENVTGHDVSQLNHYRNSKRPVQSSDHTSDNRSLKKMKQSANLFNRWSQFPSRFGTLASTNVANVEPINAIGEEKNSATDMRNRSSLQMHQSALSEVSELKWYTSPEMSREQDCTFASNIYCLGVLLFELLGDFDSGMSRAAAVLDLCHRIIPPSFLSENPKESGFCLWLLHPEPSLRPTTREILQSDLMNGMQGRKGGNLSSVSGEELEESDLLSFFLLSLNEQKISMH